MFVCLFVFTLVFTDKVSYQMMSTVGRKSRERDKHPRVVEE